MMRQRARRRASLVTGAALTATLLTAAPASAITDTPLPDVHPQITAFLDANRVPQDAQDELIAKLHAGQPWDNQSGKTPTATEVTTAGGIQKTVYRYEDGSVSVEEVSLPQPATPQGSVGTFSVSQCRLVTGSNYHATYDDCFVSRNDGVARASFRVGYTKYAGGTKAEITRAKNLSITYYYGEYSGETLTVQRKVATPSYQAVVRAQWKIKMDYPLPIGGSSTSTGHLEFKLNANGTYSSGYKL